MQERPASGWQWNIAIISPSSSLSSDEAQISVNKPNILARPDTGLCQSRVGIISISQQLQQLSKLWSKLEIKH